MTTTERLALVLGSVVSLMTIIGSVSYAAVSLNNLTTSIERYSEEMVWVRNVIEEKSANHTVYEDTLKEHERRIGNMEDQVLKKIFVNHEFSLLQYKDNGEEKVIRIPSERVER